MREIFLVLEQQRVSRDAIENLGPPSEERHMQALRKQEQEERQQKKINETPVIKKKQESKPKN